jgi:molecular chaperone DnaK (HSP70)
MVEEAQAMKAEDDARVAVVEARHQLESLVYQMFDFAHRAGASHILDTKGISVRRGSILVDVWAVFFSLVRPVWQAERAAKEAQAWMDAAPRTVAEYTTKREQLEDLMTSLM